MAVFNYEGEEINAKIVYYGPGLSGKTTNLEFIYSKLPRENKGKMVSMKTRTDRTLFFDFLPIEVGGINGMKIRFLLYTVPGQVYYNATRKLVLKGVDAVVFVADSAPDRMPENKESIRNLEENLNDLSMSLKDMPWVMQFNKRDLPDRVDRTVMENELNAQRVPSFEAVATQGKGVYETFEAIGALVIDRMQRELKRVPPGREKAPPGADDGRSRDFEIVAKGRSAIRSSETDEGESMHHAEEREEERESVSEFVDHALQEKDRGEESVDLGATREGYEDYGHLVDLNDEGTRMEPKPADRMEIINAPLGGPAARPSKRADAEGGRREPPVKIPAAPAERVVRIPVTISKEDIEKNVAVTVLLEVTVK